MNQGTTLLVNKQDLSDIRFEVADLPSEDELATGEILFSVDHFSFTSNNITYAATGDELNYWNFFPADDGFGKVPCWGFGTVLKSKHEDISTGDRFYGYFPIASHLVVLADKVRPSGFYAGSAHRKPLPTVYNHYQNTNFDLGYDASMEGQHMLFHPLFATSFLLEDFLVEQQFFGAERLLLTSASSKTSIALAFLLKQRKEREGIQVKVTGLTSQKNSDFVNSLEFYDEVITYDEVALINKHPSTTIIDFAGNKRLLMHLQELLNDSLKFISFIGISHREARSGSGTLTVNKAFFFAPAQASKRTADWGPLGLQKRMVAQWFPFIKSSKKWLNIIEGQGIKDLEKVYNDMLNGRVNPSEGHLLTLNKKE